MTEASGSVRVWVSGAEVDYVSTAGYEAPAGMVVVGGEVRWSEWDRAQRLLDFGVITISDDRPLVAVGGIIDSGDEGTGWAPDLAGGMTIAELLAMEEEWKR